MKLRANPFCECDECQQQNRLRPATDVDHVIDRRERPDLELEWSNLQSLAHACHSRKTASRQRRQ